MRPHRVKFSDVDNIFRFLVYIYIYVRKIALARSKYCRHWSFYLMSATPMLCGVRNQIVIKLQVEYTVDLYHTHTHTYIYIYIYILKIYAR